MDHPGQVAETSRRLQPLAQIFLCRGCCCGQLERRNPLVPVDEFKALWKTEKLNRSVQLTVSGCLGPCERANVVLVMAPGGAAWLGPLREGAAYQLLIDWSRQCHSARRILSLPDELGALRFERFQSEFPTELDGSDVSQQQLPIVGISASTDK
jgi:hypothetical protein